jgi:hypothetical protein
VRQRTFTPFGLRRLCLVLDLSGGGTGGAVLAAAPGLGVRAWLTGQAPGKAASGGLSGGLMVLVTAQPGWSFWIWRSSQAWRCCGESRLV